MPARKAKKPARKAKKALRKAVKKRVSRQKADVRITNPNLPLLSLLILECDTNLLASQSLSVAKDIDRIVKLLPRRLTVEVALIKTKDDLLEAFADYTKKYRAIKLVVVIAHSDSQVISLAPGMVVGWGAFAGWLQPFRPQKLVSIACNAGQFPPTRILFDEINSLKEIYASPVKLWIRQVEAMKILIPYLLVARRLDADIITAGQIITFIRNGGIILRCRRRQTEGNEFLQFLGGLIEFLERHN